MVDTKRIEKEVEERKDLLEESEKQIVNVDKVLNESKKQMAVIDKTLQALPFRTKTIKVGTRTWGSLKSLKKENETFDDVIKGLLNERTLSAEKGNMKAIKYSRKTLFLKTHYRSTSLGVEFEYNDVKNQQTEFTLDLKIKKVFYGKKSLNPSVFFGLDSHHKHLSPIYLNLYLKCVALALEKEFKIYLTGMYSDEEFEDIAKWKKIYYDYNLSEESFNHDIEYPLNLSEEESITEEHKSKMKESLSGSMWDIEHLR